MSDLSNVRTKTFKLEASEILTPAQSHIVATLYEKSLNVWRTALGGWLEKYLMVRLLTHPYH